MFLQNPPILPSPPFFFFRENCRESDHGDNEKLKLSESVLLGNRERDEKEGSFRVFSYKRRELTSPTPALAPVLYDSYIFPTFF